MQEKLDVAAIVGRGTADIIGPQVDADWDAQVQGMQEESPRKRCKNVRDDMHMEDDSNGSKFGATDEEMDASSSSDDLVIIT